jgi:hypothetical protein
MKTRLINPGPDLPLLQDVTDPEILEIRISTDGARVWINSDVGVLFRAWRVGSVTVHDERLTPEIYKAIERYKEWRGETK